MKTLHSTLTLTGTLSALMLGTVSMPTSTAQAFCGFYVSGAEASLYNDATLVVLMREGRRTVLSMQNNYEGPPDDFALVIPVPEVLQEENVKTLPKDIFRRVDNLAAPRLVEYWEQDPCSPRIYEESVMMPFMTGAPSRAVQRKGGDDLGVTVEAEFEVAEYNIVVLSARDSGGLDTWLRQENYNIPEGAEPVLAPYVAQGTKFFVAKVDSERVTFRNGRAVLSPIRVHYDSDDFSLPVRLGLLNSKGSQDLLVHVLARGQRYQTANYDNTTVPTNLRVDNSVRTDFGGYYEALFQGVVKSKPNTVVTEYAWSAESCDPCPTSPLNQGELMTLGADVLPGSTSNSDNPIGRRGFPGGGWVLTRMHYRYDAQSLDEDLIFEPAPPIIGGRGTPNREGKMAEQTAEPSGMNNFQGRYIITHPWEGEVTCENPIRGEWGGPPGSNQPFSTPMGAGSALNEPVQNARSLVKGKTLQQLTVDNLKAFGIAPDEPKPTETKGGVDNNHSTESKVPPATAKGRGGCASCSVGNSGSQDFTLLWSLGLSLLWIRTRRIRIRAKRRQG